MRLGSIVRRHKEAIILALITAVLVAFPQVYFRIEHKDDGIYQGIELLPDSPWSPRVREVQDGYLNFGSMYWKDGKELPYLFQPLGSIIVGYLGKVFMLDINNTLLLSRILFVPIASLLMYAFIYLLSRDKLVALVSTAIILLADSALSLNGLTKLFHGISPEDFLSIGKPVNNAMIYIPFFGFLVLFWLFYQNKKWMYGVLAALVLGLNFYNYFYTWTYLYAFGAILVSVLLIQRNWNESLRIGSVFLGALLVALPYIINLHRVTLHPLYDELSMRIGVLLTHAPLSVGAVVLASVVVFFVGYPRENSRTYWFSFALLLAPFLTLNQQILTGKVMQEGHYHWYFHKPMAIILTNIVIFSFLTQQKLFIYKKALAAFMFVVSVGIGTFIQIDSYHNSTVDGGTVAVERQRYGPVMKWLADNADKDDVVFGNDEVSQLVTIYTSLNVFYHRGAPYSSLAATEDRLHDILFSFYRLRNIGLEASRDIFFKERATISYFLYHVHYRDSLGSDEAIPDDEIERILSQYQATLITPTPTWFKDIAMTYEIEYFVWDKKTNPEWQMEQLPFLTKMVEFEDLVIYQFADADRDEKERVTFSQRISS